MITLRSIFIGIVLISFCTLSYPLSTRVGGSRKYWVYFRDKGVTRESFRQGNDIYERTRALLSARSLKRRRNSAIYENSGALLNLEDAPLYQPYLDSLQKLGIRALSSSRWLNAISASLADTDLQRVASLSFVSVIEAVALPVRNTITVFESPVFLPSPAKSSALAPEAIPLPCGYDSVIYHYGLSASQLARIGVPALHAMGFDAAGITIGFFDTGFNSKGMRTTRDRNIVDKYDFVYRDSNVADDGNDAIPADAHGSLVLSAAIGYLPDSIVAPAFNATVYLGKTEDLRSETPVEEEYYAEALEWIEARGADIASSSLGYLTYDSGFASITYPKLDGRTTVAARAALAAARRGMLVVTAAGNGGGRPMPYMMTPGDADSIITVGALLQNDTIADFSSRGPTYDGRLKPEICAPGAGVMTMNRSDVIQGAGGTSLATPLVSSACALILQAHPEATAQAVRKAVMQTGVRFGPPDTAYGYGRLNAYAAALELGTIIGPHRQWRVDSIHHVCVPLAANNKIVSPRIVYTVDNKGLFAASVPLTLAADSLIYSAAFPPLPKGKHVRYYIETLDGADTVTRSPRNAPIDYYEFYAGDTIIADTPSSVTAVRPDERIRIYPNPSIGKCSVISMVNDRVTYTMTDILGNKVLSFETTQFIPSVEIRFGSLPAGIYVLHGQLNDGTTVITQRIVRIQ